jgi:hypothetical protein
MIGIFSVEKWSPRSQTSALSLGPGKGALIELEDMLGELGFLRPYEVGPIKLDIVGALWGVCRVRKETDAWGKRGETRAGTF